MTGFLSTLFRFCASLKLTVLLLLFVLAACAYGTFFEGTHGTKAAQAVIYKSWWFDVALALMALNISASTLKRWPFQWKHTGFVTTHAGILVLLAGAFVTHRYGVEGQLILAEGESSHVVFHDDSILLVGTDDGEPPSRLATRFEHRPWETEPASAYALPEKNLRLEVDRYFPDAVFHESVTGDGPTPYPALHLTLGSPMMGDEPTLVWLLAADPRRRSVALGPMTASFEVVESYEEFDALAARIIPASAPKAPPAPDLGALGCEIGGASASLALAAIEDGAVPEAAVGDSGITVRVVRYFPWFVLSDDGSGKNVARNRGGAPRNPALEVEIQHGDEAAQRVFAFLNFEMVTPEPTVPIRLTWTAPDLRAASAHGDLADGGESKELRFCLLPDGEIRYVSNIGVPPASGTVSMGESVPLSAETGLSFAVRNFHPNARIETEVHSHSQEVKNPAVHVRVSRPNGAAGEAWVPFRATVPVALGDERVRVSYRSAWTELPFSLQLVDFKEDRYPGNMMAAAYSSRVIIQDPEKGVAREHLISMNNVLDWRGYRFFQSSFNRDPETGREISILAVNRDPGKAIVYVGFTVIVLGILFLFYVQPALRRRRAARGETAPSESAPLAPQPRGREPIAVAAGFRKPARDAVRPAAFAFSEPTG